MNFFEKNSKAALVLSVIAASALSACALNNDLNTAANPQPQTGAPPAPPAATDVLQTADSSSKEENLQSLVLKEIHRSTDDMYIEGLDLVYEAGSGEFKLTYTTVDTTMLDSEDYPHPRVNAVLSGQFDEERRTGQASNPNYLGHHAQIACYDATCSTGKIEIEAPSSVDSDVLNSFAFEFSRSK